MKYNERIRELREDQSLTQQRIADLLHIGQRTYADYESGKTRIPVDSLLILARFYNVSMDYIAGASNQKKPYPADWPHIPWHAAAARLERYSAYGKIIFA